MNSVVWLMLAACIGGMHAAPSLPPLPVNPGGIGGLFRGPNSETIIRGPDGSEITSEQIGGVVQTETRLEPIIVPDYNDQIAVEVASNSGYPLQISTGATVPIEVPAPEIPTLVATAKEPHLIETELVDAPDVEPNQRSDLEGPSGSISVRGSTAIVSGPASTTISEPVRRLPTIALPVVPSPVLIPPSPPINLDGVRSNGQIPPQFFPYPTLNTGLIPPPPPDTQGPRGGIVDNPSVSLQSQAISSTPIPPESLPPNAIDLGQTIVSTTQRSNVLIPPNPPVNSDGIHSNGQFFPYPRLNTELIPPPPPDTQGPRGGIVDNPSVSLQSQAISSTPQEPLPPNAIDLGQTIVSTTQKSNIAAPSTVDIDVGQIHLGQTIGVPSQSTVPPLISSTSPQILSSSIRNEATSLPPSRPLLTTDLNLSLSGTPIFTPNGLTGRIDSQDQSILTNQIVSNTPRLPSDEAPTNNIPSRSWLKVDADHILPSTVGPPVGGGNGNPISTVLDTVLVQPTDPRNREVIEFGGKKLENVGNIVPVLHHPVLLAGGLTHIHQIPTASISQLTSRDDANIFDHNRYGRQTKRN